MSSQRYFKFLIVSAIALSSQTTVIAQTKPEIATEKTQLQNRLSSPWENAVSSRTMESTTTINKIEFSPDGEILATVGAAQITLWQVERGEIKRILPGHYAAQLDLEIAPTAIAFSPDSNFLATATWSQGLLTPDRSLVVWNTATGEEVLSLKESGGCRQVLFDLTGKILYSACDLGVTAWSFPEGKKLFSLDTKYPVEIISLHPQGKIMATVDVNTTGGQQGEKSNQIQLWQLDGNSSTLLNTLDGHVNDITKIEFTADGRKLVSSSYDGKINVWNWQQGTIDRKTNNLYSKSGLFSLNANSNLIAGNFHSSTITSLNTGLPLKNFMGASVKKENRLMMFSPSDRLLVEVKKSPEDKSSKINLWQTNIPQPNKAKAIADNYLSIPVTERWTNQLNSDLSELPTSIGRDPEAIALSALGLTEIIESEKEEVETEYPQDDMAIVTITQTNLLDDSLAAIRYKVKFAPYGDRDESQWQVVWAGQQFQCRVNRGDRDWSKNLCQ